MSHDDAKLDKLLKTLERESALERYRDCLKNGVKSAVLEIGIVELGKTDQQILDDLERAGLSE